MSEQHDLTTPETSPVITVTSYRLKSVFMDGETIAPTATERGQCIVVLKDNNGAYKSFEYKGEKAQEMIKFLNTSNNSVKSMQKRILEQLEKDGLIGAGDVSGAPDLPADVVE